METDNIASKEMTISAFQEKYGHSGKALVLLVGDFIRRAPEFKGGEALAYQIGIILADLETALKGHKE